MANVVCQVEIHFDILIQLYLYLPSKLSEIMYYEVAATRAERERERERERETEKITYNWRDKTFTAEARR